MADRNVMFGPLNFNIIVIILKFLAQVKSEAS